MLAIFDQIARELEDETALRDGIRQEVKELEKLTRAIGAQLNAVHSNATQENITLQGTKALESLAQVRSQISKLASLTPPDQYFRYNSMWTFPLQSACFLSAYAYYMKNGRLLTTQEAEQILGVPVSLDSSVQTFHVSIEEYLHGIISLTSELTRLAVNSVTAGDFSRPLEIHKFVSDLHAGFQMLNLKNDSLRKRFDSLKYEVKRVEEIVYDISVRGLAGKKGATAAP
ncbi:translin [Zopfochytrium polystomum]|nr:translin [Zopfochytrium polystomum]